MCELLVRVCLAILAFTVIVLVILLYARQYENSKLRRECEQLRSLLKEANQINKSLQHNIEDLLDERKEDAIQRDIAKAIIESNMTKSASKKYRGEDS